MASPQHQQLLTEVSCDSSGEGGVSVRISSSIKHKHGGGAGALGGIGGGFMGGGSKHCKYSISSSCSSGESGVLRPVVKGLRTQRKMPQLFERSAGHFWDPKFDSPILEEACRERCFPQTQRRFRYVLFYLFAASLLWGVYFSANPDRCDRTAFLVPTACFLFFCLLLFLLTFTRIYARCYNQASLLLIVVTFALTLAPQIQTAGFRDLETLPPEDVVEDVGDVSGMEPRNVTFNRDLPRGSAWAPCLSPVGTFSLGMEVLLLLYSVLHVRLYASVLLGLLYSVLFEALGWLHLTQAAGDGWSQASEGADSDWDTLRWLGPAKALLHLCAHAIGIHLFIMSEVRSRSTFLKVGQAIMHGKDLEVEKALKERMIHSVMPRRVADDLMKQGDEEGLAGGSSAKRYSSSGAAAVISSPKNNKRNKTSIPRGQIIFRPFNMKRMEPVSILFADIVGFTKMSANKSAHALVGLLNDLFGRFDRLCELTCCEKISTLGDCYYCVAGCPEPRPDHAYCCVEMGLGMIQAIEQFCQEKSEMVNMRVGVHTGTVLCGILGMKRFKFDVWSNDVNLANLMEQLGVAGKVHLSEATANFLDDRYQRENGQVTERVGQSVVADQLKGLKTYLISGRKVEPCHCSCSQLRLAGLEPGGDTRCPTPRAHTPDGPPRAPSACGLPQEGAPDRAKSPCLSCSVAVVPEEDQVLEEGMVQNGCHDDHTTNRSKDTSSLKCPSQAPVGPVGRSPKALNGLLSPRLEDPLTNSQTSLSEMLQEKEKKWGGGAMGMGMDHSALIPLRSKNFRERSDAHFVDVIKEDSLMKDYFFKPPINKLSHTFLDRTLESAYRTSYQEEVETQAAVQTFASPTFSSFLDMVLCCSVFLALSLACLLRPLLSLPKAPLPAPALALAAVAALLEALAMVLSIRMAFYLDSVMSCTRTLLRAISGWVPRHLIGAVLVSLPTVSVFSHVTCDMHLSIQFTMLTCCAVIIAIIQYCNFCQLSCWMRSAMATVVGMVLLVLLFSPPCSSANSMLFWSGDATNNSNHSSVVHGQPEPAADPVPRPQDLLGPEVGVAFFLLLLLVWFLNREFEVSYRLHYHGNVEADQHRIKIQNMRDQADWLLRNIIPIHVAEQLKVTQSYSKNHGNVGVIFASIVNFSEFYEESYEGGKECYRVLNELIGDFDELLREPPFNNIEKIKTIGATYMAAAGLNAQQCAEAPHPHGHLRALFDFALEMMRVVDDFNKNMLGFKFKLRIGFNHGPLTAGVIGTTKLLYDIWGDTVNIASRMDTTGVECRVQVSEESYCALSAMDYNFDYRGTVNVKGKGQMKTFLFPKSADSGAPVPQYLLSVSPEIRVQVDGSIGRSPTDELSNMVPSSMAGVPSTTSPSHSPRVSTGLLRPERGMVEAGDRPDSREQYYCSPTTTETITARRSSSSSSYVGLASLPITSQAGATLKVQQPTLPIISLGGSPSTKVQQPNMPITSLAGAPQTSTNVQQPILPITNKGEAPSTNVQESNLPVTSLTGALLTVQQPNLPITNKGEAPSTKVQQPNLPVTSLAGAPPTNVLQQPKPVAPASLQPLSPQNATATESRKEVEKEKVEKDDDDIIGELTKL
ncbi:adenylate cyclase type 9-like [Coregonus clupeaformis]|uniref:adenylate cyclase type 9-like n=1 Tax=Coregonus clupeaformis TaxID=59861 RepID=UPI001E1C8BE4|nr:adenylate cyclase type 9-like [Coregonus clupeaformis]